MGQADATGKHGIRKRIRSGEIDRRWRARFRFKMLALLTI